MNHIDRYYTSELIEALDLAGIRTSYLTPLYIEDCAICFNRIIFNHGSNRDLRGHSITTLHPEKTPHVFDSTCLDYWFRFHTSCPSCRRKDWINTFLDLVQSRKHKRRQEPEYNCPYDYDPVDVFNRSKTCQKEYIFRTATEFGDLEMLELLLNDDPSFLEKTVSLSEPRTIRDKGLIDASRMGCLNVVRYLLKDHPSVPADVRAECIDWAMRCHHSGIVDFFSHRDTSC